MNSCYQLTKNHGAEIVFPLIQFASKKACQVIACGFHSFILSDTPNDDLSGDNDIDGSHHQVGQQNINSLVTIIKEQSRAISQLMEVCRDLQQQNAVTQSKMNEIIEQQNKQSEEIQKFHKEFKAQVQKGVEMDAKIESVVQYVKSQDYF